MFLDCLLDLLLRILRTGVEIFLDKGHALEAPGVFDHFGHLDHPSDVDPAVADENADPGLLVYHIDLRRILFFLR